MWFFCIDSDSFCWCFFFFSSRRRHTRCLSDWSSDVCSSDLGVQRPVQCRLTRPVEAVDHEAAKRCGAAPPAAPLPAGTPPGETPVAQHDRRATPRSANPPPSQSRPQCKPHPPSPESERKRLRRIARGEPRRLLASVEALPASGTRDHGPPTGSTREPCLVRY